MNTTEKQFIEILSKSIRMDKNVNNYNGVNWANLANMALEHKVEGIIYSAITDEEIQLKVDKKIVEELKATSFYTKIEQIRKMSYLDNIFEKFNHKNIEVLAVKGVVLKNIYPEHTHRSMNDANIIVKKKDIGRVKELLGSIGYEEKDENNKLHLKFNHRLFPTIEVHCSFIEGKELPDSIWNNAVKDRVMNTEIQTLGYEDFIVQLCCNMANNMKKLGLGVRQLTDLVLYIEAHRDSINWTSFIEKAEEHGVKKFSLIMFYLCHKLFGMEIPEGILTEDILDDKYINLIIEDIMLSGIYNKKNNVNLLHEEEDSNADETSIQNKEIIESEIVSVENKIDDIKNKLLNQIDNIKHAYKNIFNEDYSLIENIKIIIRKDNIYKHRNEVIKWLEL